METINEEKKNNLNEKDEKESYEAKSIKYKNMFTGGTQWSSLPKKSSSLQNLDKFLEQEKNNNAVEPWSKIDKTVKLKKLLSFAETYKTENSLNETEFDSLITFFKDCLSRKKLARVKDVIYDKTTGLIKEIPALYYNKNQNNFSLKNIDKRVSTIKSLTPKKVNGTLKNNNNIKIDSDKDSEDES